MPAKIKHLAIVSDNYALLGKFYEALFKMRTSNSAKPDSAVVVSDGYVGMNINPRRPGRQAGLDHFGFEVDDVDKVYARMREISPSVRILKRPSNRPFAGLSTHDPAGNVFDLSQAGMENRTNVYVEAGQEHERHVKHFTLRAVDPSTLARFYRDALELVELEKPADDPSRYLTDGKVTLVVTPWDIRDFGGTGIERPAMDHIGFKVESVESFKKDLQALKSRNPHLAPRDLDAGPEGEARHALFSKCKYGAYQLSDPDGVLLDIVE